MTTGPCGSSFPSWKAEIEFFNSYDPIIVTTIIYHKKKNVKRGNTWNNFLHYRGELWIILYNIRKRTVEMVPFNVKEMEMIYKNLSKIKKELPG